jgi:hypothetical protein
MNTTTIHGNRRTTPRGTDIVEFPFNRKGRRKNSSLDASVCFLFDRNSSFSSGSEGSAGRRFSTLLTTSIAARIWSYQPGKNNVECIRLFLYMFVNQSPLVSMMSFRSEYSGINLMNRN